MGKGGFDLWQQGGGSQDDGIDSGAMARLFRGALAFSLEARGCSGGQAGDQPSLPSFSAVVPVGPLEVDLALARGLNDDAPRWLVQLLLAVPLRWLVL